MAPWLLLCWLHLSSFQSNQEAIEATAKKLTADVDKVVAAAPATSAKSTASSSEDKELAAPVPSGSDEDCDAIGEVLAPDVEDIDVEWQVAGRGGFATVFVDKRGFVYKNFTRPNNIKVDKVRRAELRGKSLDFEHEVRQAALSLRLKHEYCSHVLKPLFMCPAESVIVYPFVGNVHLGQRHFAVPEGIGKLEWFKQCYILNLCGAAGMLYQLAEALMCLKQHKLVHCDIKPDNIIINEDGMVTLIDVGALTAAGVAQCPQLSPWFSDKVAVASSLKADFANDIFSLGMVFIYRFANRFPYPSQEVLDARFNSGKAPKDKLNYAALCIEWLQLREEQFLSKEQWDQTARKLFDNSPGVEFEVLEAMISAGRNWSKRPPIEEIMKVAADVMVKKCGAEKDKLLGYAKLFVKDWLGKPKYCT